MRAKLTYIVQGAGFVLGAIGLVLTFKHPEITALLGFGALAWWVGGYARAKNLF